MPAKVPKGSGVRFGGTPIRPKNGMTNSSIPTSCAMIRNGGTNL
jgi:hypothetical protein